MSGIFIIRMLICKNAQTENASFTDLVKKFLSFLFCPGGKARKESVKILI